MQLAVFRCQCWLLLLWRRTASPWVTASSSVRVACESLTSCCVPQIILSSLCVKLVNHPHSCFDFLFRTQWRALNLRVLQGLSNRINQTMAWAPSPNNFDYLQYFVYDKKKLNIMYQNNTHKLNKLLEPTKIDEKKATKVMVLHCSMPMLFIRC